MIGTAGSIGPAVTLVMVLTDCEVQPGISYSGCPCKMRGNAKTANAAHNEMHGERQAMTISCVDE